MGLGIRSFGIAWGRWVCGGGYRPQVQAEFAGRSGRDKHCGFFSSGKANQYQPTMEAKSLTIYAQVQKSGVSSIFSFVGWACPVSRGIPGQSTLQNALNFSARWDYLLLEIVEITG